MKPPIEKFMVGTTGNPNIFSVNFSAPEWIRKNYENCSAKTEEERVSGDFEITMSRYLWLHDAIQEKLDRENR